MDDSYWTRRMASATQHAEVMHVLQALHQDELHRIAMYASRGCDRAFAAPVPAALPVWFARIMGG